MQSFFSILFSGAPPQLALFWASVVTAWNATWWIVLPIIAAIMFWEFWLVYLHVRFVRAINWKLLEIKIPKNILKTPKAMEQIFASAHAPYSYGIPFINKYWKGDEEFWMSFELVGRAGESHFYLRVPSQFRHMMEAAIYGSYPEAELVEVDEYMAQFPEILPNKDFDISAFEEVLRHENYLPIRTYPEFEEAVEEQRLDPIAMMMETMSRLRDDQQLWYQLIVKPTGEEFRKAGEKKIAEIFSFEEKKKPSGNIFSGFGLGVTLGEVIQSPFKHPEGPAMKEQQKQKMTRMILTPAEKEMTEGIEEKIAKIAFEATVRFVYINRRGADDAGFTNTVHGFIRQFNTQHLNSLRPNGKTSTASWSVHGLFKKAKIRWRKRLMWENCRKIVPAKKESILNIEELATIFHFPIGVVSTTELEKISSRKGSPPAGIPIVEE